MLAILSQLCQLYTTSFIGSFISALYAFSLWEIYIFNILIYQLISSNL